MCRYRLTVVIGVESNAHPTQYRSFLHSQSLDWQTKQYKNTCKLNQLKKQTTQSTVKQNYTGLVISNDTRPGNEMGLILQRSRAQTGLENKHQDFQG